MNEEITPVEVLSPMKLNIVDYSTKSFIVFGEATKTYKNDLKALGGKFNNRLKERPGFSGGPAWIFPTTLKTRVNDYVNRVNTGDVFTQEDIPSQGNQSSLPTVMLPLQNKTRFQTVRWRVFKPETGMAVIIKANGGEMKGEVIQIDTHKDIVDTVYAVIGRKTSKLVIVNGVWQVWGYIIDHTVFFSDNESKMSEI